MTDDQTGGTAAYGLWLSAYGNTLVYTETIFDFSPPTNSRSVQNEVHDLAKLHQTLAHEIGHNLGLDERPFPSGAACPPGADTVMMVGYFSKTTNVSDCRWTHIPNDYRPVEKQTFRLR